MMEQNLLEQAKNMTSQQLRNESRLLQSYAEFIRTLLVVREAEEAAEAAVLDLAPSRGSSSAKLKLTTSPPSKRKMILRRLGENPGESMRLVDLKNELVGRGWLDDTKDAAHSLGVSAYKAFQKGELDRPKHGYYQITEKGLSVDTR